MAEIKPVLLDSEGFILEMDPTIDSITLNGLTLTGDINMSASGTITNLTAPVNDDDAATKVYVDSVAQGLQVHGSVVATTTSGVGSYAAGGGAGGEGQLTSAWEVVDGITLVEGDRVLVNSQTDAKQNGIYVVTATVTTWDRSDDWDDAGDVHSGDFCFIQEGDTYADTGWVMITDSPVLNSTDMVWEQFSGAGQITAGAGLVKDGNVIDVELGTNSGLEFDVGGDAGKLQVNLDGTTLQLGAGGISVLGLPSQFEVNGSAVSTNVTQANLDTLVAGVSSDADALHTHDGLSSSGHGHSHASTTGQGTDDHHPQSHTVASHSDTTATGGELNELTDGSSTALHSHAVATSSGIANPYNADTGGVTEFYPVFHSGNDVISDSDAANSDATKTIGVALSTETVGNPAIVVTHGEAAGVLSGATAGDYFYLAVGGGLTSTKPNGSGNRIVLMGHAINATDLYVDVQYMGRLN